MLGHLSKGEIEQEVCGPGGLKGTLSLSLVGAAPCRTETRCIYTAAVRAWICSCHNMAALTESQTDDNQYVYMHFNNACYTAIKAVK